MEMKAQWHSQPQVIRQDRIECDPERHAMKSGEVQIGQIQNYSPFGFAIESKQQLADSYDELVMTIDGYEISQVTAHKVREYQQNGKYVSGYTITGAPLDLDAALAIKELNETLRACTELVGKESKIKSDFKLQVLEFKDLLLKLEERINGLQVSTFTHNASAVTHFEDRVAQRVSNYLSSHLSPTYQKISRALEGLPKDELAEHFRYFRECVGQIMYKSVYAHRAFYKPKGYAGDYEMMNNVYHRELRGESLFAKCLQRYFVDEPAGQAVRNREVYMRSKIVEVLHQSGDKATKILSVASGPAFELQNLVKMGVNLEKAQFFILDQDLDALKFAQRRIQEAARGANVRINLNLLNLNIKQVIQNGLPEQNFDLIYSAGLFDYFTDPVAVYAATQLVKSTKAGGRVIIGNFSKDNPNQLAMELIMDWDLICRTKEDLMGLFGPLGTCTIEAENQGINLFANIQK